jgi:hypothetical protein
VSTTSQTPDLWNSCAAPTPVPGRFVRGPIRSANGLGRLLAIGTIDLQAKTVFGPRAVPSLIREVREERHTLTDPRQVAEPVGHVAACFGARAGAGAYTDVLWGHTRNTARVPRALAVPRRTSGRSREDNGEDAHCRHVPASHSSPPSSSPVPHLENVGAARVAPLELAARATPAAAVSGTAQPGPTMADRSAFVASCAPTRRTARSRRSTW